MDRRQRKTREAIFHAFTDLLSQKAYHSITVGEIIDRADIGRATFYAHFETKDYLLKALCEELFCHIFDTQFDINHEHRHIFECSGSDSVFLHLFQHLQKNDQNILSLLSCRNNELFLRYFRSGIEGLITENLYLFENQKIDHVPEAFWKNHILSTFMGTLEWWLAHGRTESPEVITEYFFNVL